MAAEKKCEHCGKPLPYISADRGGDGCYLKHGCWGEVKEYLDTLDPYDKNKIRQRLLGEHGCEKYDILGQVHPVDWMDCGDELLKYFKITRKDQIDFLVKYGNH
jgi:hypothetical protein